MDPALFERLLYEEEGPTLDFKKDQYRFAKATEEEKSELLKDILGFVNAWRRSEAYILIGVEDVRGGKATVVGIAPTDHLDDHSLQQFVNNLTSHPVRFQYEAFGFDGQQVGILRIEEQPRPAYLKKDYGKLKKNAVYVRRGSSTDPAKPATPEEIAQMGSVTGHQSAELTVEFADPKRDDPLGQHLRMDSEHCLVPPREDIPDLANPSEQRAWGMTFHDPTDRPNEDYFRQLADFEFATRLFRPVRLVVKNVGTVAAHKVRVELTVPTNIDAEVIEGSDLPGPPALRADLFRDAFGRAQSALAFPGQTSIDRNPDRFRVEIDCGDLQPGRRVWSEVFYVARLSSGDLCASGQVFSEDLPQPRAFSLTTTLNVKDTKLSVEELTTLPEPREEHD